MYVCNMCFFWPRCAAAPLCDPWWSQTLKGLNSVALQHVVSIVRHGAGYGVKVSDGAHMLRGKSFIGRFRYLRDVQLVYMYTDSVVCK